MRRSRQPGQALVEFSLVALVLVALLLVVVEGALLARDAIRVHQASREAALAVMQARTPAEAHARLHARAAEVLADPGRARSLRLQGVDLATPQGFAPGRVATVRVVAAHTPVVLPLLGDVPLRASTTVTLTGHRNYPCGVAPC